jgi:hypothetical protein
MALRLDDLHNDPLGVAETYALRITGHAKSRPNRFTVFVEAGPLSYTETIPTTLDQLQVKAGIPVYAVAMEGAGIDHSGKSVLISAVNENPRDAPRAYYLPWAKRSIYRITPKPATAEGLDGNLFFTANLDGCMLSIMGAPDKPTIYHSNAAGLDYDPNPTELLENLAKIDTMRKAVATFASKGNLQAQTTQSAKQFWP